MRPDPATPHDVALYAFEILSGLRALTLAQGVELAFLSYLIEMAASEAAEQAR
jgi:hypothetical protein